MASLWRVFFARISIVHSGSGTRKQSRSSDQYLGYKLGNYFKQSEISILAVCRHIFVTSIFYLSTYYPYRSSFYMYVNITLTGLRCGPPSEVLNNPNQFDGHCQLSRPWYARCVGGAVASGRKVLCLPIVLPRSNRAGRKKAPWVR